MRNKRKAPALAEAWWWVGLGCLGSLDPDVDVSAMLHQVDGVVEVFVCFVDDDDLTGFVGGCNLVVHLGPSLDLLRLL
jgi:hypothetical protein